MAEQFEIRKLVKSPFTGLFWVKSFMYMLGIGCIIFIGFSIYRIFNPKATQQINIAKGATAKIIQNTQGKRYFIPFIEGGIEKNSDVDFDTYIRTGLRIEW